MGIFNDDYPPEPGPETPLRRGYLLAGRFEVRGDEEATARARRRAWDAYLAGGCRSMAPWEDPDIWLRGVEVATGEPVLIEPSDPDAAFSAHSLVRRPPPHGVEVLSIIDRYIMYSAPPAGVPRGGFSRSEAAELTLQACETVADLHARGHKDLAFDPLNLRVVRDHDRAVVHWLVPGALDLQDLADHGDGDGLISTAKFAWGRSGGAIIKSHICHLVSFFFALQPAGSRFLGKEPEAVALERIRRNPDGPTPPDVATLARLLGALIPDPPGLAYRIASLPSVMGLGVPGDRQQHLGEPRLEGLHNPLKPVDWKELLK